MIKFVQVNSSHISQSIAQVTSSTLAKIQKSNFYSPFTSKYIFFDQHDYGFPLTHLEKGYSFTSSLEHPVLEHPVNDEAGAIIQEGEDTSSNERRNMERREQSASTSASVGGAAPRRSPCELCPEAEATFTAVGDLKCLSALHPLAFPLYLYDSPSFSCLFSLQPQLCFRVGYTVK